MVGLIVKMFKFQLTPFKFQDHFPFMNIPECCLVKRMTNAEFVNNWITDMNWLREFSMTRASNLNGTVLFS